jgi:predicted aldo/keto reductase-like oxidoreductase
MSVHDTPENMTRTLELHDWDFVQLQLNYIDWDTMDMKLQFQAACDKGTPVIIMEPLRGGALARLDGGAAAMLREAEPTLSAASWALRFAMSLPNVATILSGMSSLEQVMDNLHTIDLEKPFGEAERRLVKQAAASFLSSGTIPCTACNYCMDCPSGVDIPRMFALYNTYCALISPGTYHAAYYNIGAGKQAHCCASCGICEPLCPQHIPIMDNMKLIAQTVDGFDL